MRTIDVAAHAGTAFDGKHLFQIAEDRIQKIDPKGGRVLSTIPAPGGGGDSGPAWAEGALWVGHYRARKIYQVDPNAGEILRTIESNRSSARQFVASVPEQDADKPSDSLDLALLEILWLRLHRQGTGHAPLELRIKTELTPEINTYVLATGDTQDFSAESLGSRIALLGFDTKRDKHSSKLRLTPQTGRRLHQLARKLDPMKSVSGCPDCEQMLADRRPPPAAGLGKGRRMER